MNQAPTTTYCAYCGHPTVDGRCTVCGSIQPDPVQPNQPQPNQAQPNPAQPYAAYVPPTQPIIYNQSDGEGAFIDPNEQVVYQLGSGYLGTFLAGGGITKNMAAVTNKRVYYKGKALASVGGVGLKRCKITQIIDLKDVTCVGIYKAFNIALVVIAVLLFISGIIIMALIPHGDGVAPGIIAMVVAAIMVAAAIVGARTMLRVDYAGGCIALDIKSFSKKACEDFRIAVYREKDRVTNYRG